MAITHIAPMLEKRLKELNNKIDSKILRGQSYRNEAREHRMLLLRLKGYRTGMLAQPFSFLRFR